jgi:pimeloyl-ACP methyl ester carboxylesterase
MNSGTHHPVVLVPGLNCSARLYTSQLPTLWQFGPVTVANHTGDDTMGAIAARILEAAPPRFALAGLSMGGYIAFEVLRQAPERITKLALLDTAARPDRPEQSARRDELIGWAEGGRFSAVTDALWPILVHPERREDKPLRDAVEQMAEETGPAAFVRQQRAIKARPDSRPDLAGINCPTLVLVGDADALTPPELAREMADAIPASRLVVVERSGHLSTLEQPDAVNAALAAWMERTA